ncbi:hypothetical protein LAZ67_1002483, partial [Cordylochernes scorpioides]
MIRFNVGYEVHVQEGNLLNCCLFFFLISTQSYQGIKLVEFVDGVCWGCVFFFLIYTQSYQGIKLVEFVDGVCWGCVFFFLISTQSYQGIKLVKLVDGVCWGCVFFLIYTQSYQGIKFVELVDGVCWGCVFFFLISTQSYQGIKLVEFVDGVCWGCVFFFLISTQSYQGIKSVELVDGVCWGCVFFFLISTQSYQGIKLVELVDVVCWECVFFLISIQSYQGIKLVELVDGVCWECVFFLISIQSYQGIQLVELVDGKAIYIMWLTSTKVHHATLKDACYTQLLKECRLAAPGARLSYSLRSKMERFPAEDKKEICSRINEGCAPLFIACKKGNVEIVEYLIVECGADVEQRGIFEVPEDRSIHHVTPLWCAAVAGKLPVVKKLIQHGADVNSVSDTGSTPVRSACFMTHLEIVMYLVENGADILKPNYNGGTCLINSVQSVPLCEFLLKHGADVNARDIQFKTALHYAIQEHRFETTKLLLDYHANPTIRSRYNDDALQTACLKGATQIFEYLIDNFNYSKERIAEAHELMGSTFLDEHHDLQTALHYWETALKIRYENPSAPILKPLNIPLNAAYLNAKEFQTFEELENMMLDLDAMRNQSLLMCERILEPLHRDMIFRLMFRGAAYADSLQYQRCIDLWRYALSLRIRKDGLLHNEVCFTAQALVRLFLDLHEKQIEGLMAEDLHFDDIYVTITLLVDHFEASMKLLNIRPIFKRQQDNFDNILKILSHLIYIINIIPKTAPQEIQTIRLIRDILKMRPRSSTKETLLHLAVSKANKMKTNAFFEDPQTAIFPDPGVTRLLLDCGAGIEAVNTNLSTPLHIACMNTNYHSDVVKVLLEYGGHIDRRSGN